MNIRAAAKEDIPDIVALIAQHVRQGELLPRSAESIETTLDDWLVGEDKEGDLVACV